MVEFSGVCLGCLFRRLSSGGTSRLTTATTASPARTPALSAPQGSGAPTATSTARGLTPAPVLELAQDPSVKHYLSLSHPHLLFPRVGISLFFGIWFSSTENICKRHIALSQHFSHQSVDLNFIYLPPMLPNTIFLLVIFTCDIIRGRASLIQECRIKPSIAVEGVWQCRACNVNGQPTPQGICDPITGDCRCNRTADGLYLFSGMYCQQP
jgi:hypothetical protein